MAELKTQPTVAEIDDPAETVDALRRLGVAGRAEFVAENRNVLGHLREEGDLLHVYLYHFLYETGDETTVEVALPGHGAVHRVDAWTGRTVPHQGVRAEGDRTVLAVTLAPGEVALFSVDRSEALAESEQAAYDVLQELPEWEVTVESWDAGEPEILTEDRGLGYETRELHPTTAVTPLAAGRTTLHAWSELPGVGPEVSGVGEYRTAFELERTAGAGERILLDLGSTSGGLGAVVVNGAEPVGFDTSRPVVDVTDHVRTGTNEVAVRVAGSLNNRLIARGYYDGMLDMGSLLLGRQDVHTTRVRPYGLVGPVRLVRSR